MGVGLGVRRGRGEMGTCGLRVLIGIIKASLNRPPSHRMVTGSRVNNL